MGSQMRSKNRSPHKGPPLLQALADGCFQQLCKASDKLHSTAWRLGLHGQSEAGLRTFARMRRKNWKNPAESGPRFGVQKTDPKKGAVLLGLISVQYNAPDGAHFGVRFLDPKMGPTSGYLFPNLAAHSYMFACQPYAPVVMLLCAN